MSLRVAIYARYSSDSQSSASIKDQIRLCQERVIKEGWSLAHVYRDAAISGASTSRPGYQAMMEASREAGFDIVLAEALDRLSRDQEDIAGLYKRLKFGGIRLVTISEGDISELHIGLKGTMNAIFLKDLAEKTHRGLRARVIAGKSAGGLCYGYQVVRAIDSNGEPVRGDRKVDELEAPIINRIFKMFSDGQSPTAIAKVLNRDKVPGPQGNAWRDTTIRGHAERGTGILRNEAYAGRLVWNRMHYIKDPTTGKRVSRMNPRDQWLAENVAHLQIVDTALWETVQAKLGAIRERNGANNLDWPKFWERRRSQHLLSGKVFCATCGNPMTIVGKNYLACSVARKQGLCSNVAGTRRDAIDKLVIDALRINLMQPGDVQEFVRAFTSEWNRVSAEAGASRGHHKNSLTAVQRKIDRLIDAIADGIKAPDVKDKLQSLTDEKEALQAILAQPYAALPAIHPNLAELYKSKVAGLQEALASEDNAETLGRLRDLIERVDVGVDAKSGVPEIVLTGALASMVQLGMPENGKPAAAQSDLFMSSVKVVAGARFERAAFRL